MVRLNNQVNRAIAITRGDTSIRDSTIVKDPHKVGKQFLLSYRGGGYGSVTCNILDSAEMGVHSAEFRHCGVGRLSEAAGNGDMTAQRCKQSHPVAQECSHCRIWAPEGSPELFQLGDRFAVYRDPEAFP